MSFKNLKYRFFINFFENKKKLMWTLKNNLFNNVVCPPTISVVKVTQNTILGKKNERMFVVNDSFQSWNVINDANFQIEFIKKIKSLLTSSIKYDFVDIGANIGIMTKCLLNNNIKLKNIYCVEPDQDNFFCLKNNLAKFKNIKFFKFALDKKKGKKKLYIDNNNKGNLSFFYEMIKKDKLNYMNTKNSFEIIKCENIKNFFKSINLKTNIIKIDTQGSDEIIFQEIPREVLNKNHLLIIEITPLKTKEINYKKYSNNLRHYSKFTDFNGNFYTKDEVIKLSQRKRGKNIDLIFLK